MNSNNVPASRLYENTIPIFQTVSRKLGYIKKLCNAPLHKDNESATTRKIRIVQREGKIRTICKKKFPR